MITDADQFKRGMRRLASGVSIVTTVDAGERYGLAATSVVSVSADPPTLLVCVDRKSTSNPAIAHAGFFCVNLLAQADHDVARRFGSSADRDIRFSGRQWSALVTGAPVLIDALASFDCAVVEAIDVASHTVFIGRVEAIELWQENIVPLVYHDGKYDRLSGFAGPMAKGQDGR